MKYLGALILLLLSASAFAVDHPVHAGGNIQTAVNASASGDTVTIDANVTFNLTAAITLPVHAPCTGAAGDYITIQSSEAAMIPIGAKPRALLGSSAYVHMPKIVSTAATADATFTVNSGSGCYKFLGLELTNNNTVQVQSMLDLSGNGAHLIVDRVYVHPKECPNTTPPYNTTGRLAINVSGAMDVTIKNSDIRCFFGLPPGGVAGNTAVDTQGVTASNAPGGNPLIITNNYLEAWFDIVFLGGAGSTPTNPATVNASPTPTTTTATLSSVTGLANGMFIALSIPLTWCGSPTTCWGNGKVTNIAGNAVTFTQLVEGSTGVQRTVTDPPLTPGQAVWTGGLLNNVTITYNHFHLDTAFCQWQWTNNGNTPKAFIEIKKVDTLLYEGNVHDGFAASFGPQARNEGGGEPWASVSNVTVRNNWFKSFITALFFRLADGGFLNTAGHDIVVTNNLWTGPDTFTGLTPKLTIGNHGSNVTFTHNTVLTAYPDAYVGALLTWSSATAYYTATANVIFRDNLVGWGNYGFGCDVGSISNCWPGYTEDHNIFVLSTPITPPNQTVASQFPNSSSQSAWTNMLFTNAGNNVWSLQATSPGHNAASDGTDVGVNWATLQAQIGTATGLVHSRVIHNHATFTVQ